MKLMIFLGWFFLVCHIIFSCFPLLKKIIRGEYDKAVMFIAVILATTQAYWLLKVIQILSR
jgi:hypothetical protein